MSVDPKKVAGDVQERVRDVAYLMWESAGRQAGKAMDYWLAAEREFRETLQAAAHKIMPSASAKAEPTAPSPEERVPTTEEPPAATTGKTGYKIEEIEGIGMSNAGKLAAVGIETYGDLLDRCGSAEGRAAVAEKAGISAKQLLKWTNMADLMRISGVGGEYAELLEASGVDTVKELRTRNAEALAAKMAEINAEKKLTRRLASAKQVGKWVDQAKSLDPIITH